MVYPQISIKILEMQSIAKIENKQSVIARNEAIARRKVAMQSSRLLRFSQ
jgi:hypothetical protein